MVSVKNWQFFHLFILDGIGQENMFHDIIERKNAFLRLENQQVQKAEKLEFFQTG